MNREPDWPVRFEGKPPPSRKGILGFSRVFLLSVFSTLGNWLIFSKMASYRCFLKLDFVNLSFFGMPFHSRVFKSLAFYGKLVGKILCFRADFTV